MQERETETWKDYADGALSEKGLGPRERDALLTGILAQLDGSNPMRRPPAPRNGPARLLGIVGTGMLLLLLTSAVIEAKEYATFEGRLDSFDRIYLHMKTIPGSEDPREISSATRKMLNFIRLLESLERAGNEHARAALDLIRRSMRSDDDDERQKDLVRPGPAEGR